MFSAGSSIVSTRFTVLELLSREMFPVHSGVGLEDTVNSTWHPRALLPERKVQVMVTLSPSTSTDADCTLVVSAYGRVNGTVGSQVFKRQLSESSPPKQ